METEVDFVTLEECLDFYGEKEGRDFFDFLQSEPEAVVPDGGYALDRTVHLAKAFARTVDNSLDIMDLAQRGVDLAEVTGQKSTFLKLVATIADPSDNVKN